VERDRLDVDHGGMGVESRSEARGQRDLVHIGSGGGESLGRILGMLADLGDGVSEEELP
jgi:hypothetical protein